MSRQRIISLLSEEESAGSSEKARISARRFLSNIGAFALIVLALASCSTMPRTLSDDALKAQAVVRGEERRSEMDAAVESAAQRIVWKYEHGMTLDSGEIPIDVLALSGGGAKGAFGAGFLYGWGQVREGALRRPDFDIVTGISTGSLIAPFAVLGSDEDYEDVERIYKEVRPEFAVLRGKLFFLPWRMAFLDNSHLIQYVRERVDKELVAELSEAYDQHKLLLVGTTDIDLGQFYVWNVGRELQQHRAVAQERLQDILLASSAIPAAFPPIRLDGHLHVDGGASEMVFFVTNADRLRKVLERARDLGIGDTPVVFRVWVIVNGKLTVQPEVVSQGWVSIAERSISTLSMSSTLSALQRLALVTALFNADSDPRSRCEFRYVAIPSETKIPESRNMFDEKVTQFLANLGRAISAKPNPWLESLPTYVDGVE